jgi:hypothetical protein
MLYPLWYPGASDVVFQVNPSSPNHDVHPLFRYLLGYTYINETSEIRSRRCTRRQEGILEAGDILFVPSGTPHYVFNLTNTVAVSSNFIDTSNWFDAERALRFQV